MKAAPILRSVARALGADRSSPVDAAIEKHAAARKKCDRLETEQVEAVRLAEEAYKREPTRERWRELNEVKGHAQRLVDDARQEMNEAWTEREKAEAAAKAARLTKLDEKTSTVRPHVGALADEALPHLAALVALSRKRDEIITEALAAHEEARRLRGEDHEQAYRGRMAIESARTALRIRIRESTTHDDRLRIERLLDGGPFS